MAMAGIAAVDVAVAVGVVSSVAVVMDGLAGVECQSSSSVELLVLLAMAGMLLLCCCVAVLLCRRGRGGRNDE